MRNTGFDKCSWCWCFLSRQFRPAQSVHGESGGLAVSAGASFALAGDLTALFAEGYGVRVFRLHISLG